MQVIELNERHYRVLDILKKKKQVKVKQLVEELQVSDETIRRDLKLLERYAYLRRVHGGAVMDYPVSLEYDVNTRLTMFAEEKAAIAKATAMLVKDNDTVAISASTTTMGLGSYLMEKNHLTVLTNSLYLGNRVLENSTNTVYYTGGEYYKNEEKMMGNVAVNVISGFRADKSIISPSAICCSSGVTENNFMDQSILAEMVRISKIRIVMADFSKFSATALLKVCDAADINWVVTDWNAPRSEIELLNKHEIKTIVVEKNLK